MRQLSLLIDKSIGSQFSDLFPEPKAVSFSNTRENSRLPLSSPFPSSFKVLQLLALTYISSHYLHIFAPQVLKVKLYHSLTLPSASMSQTLVLAKILWSYFKDGDALACVSSPNILDQEAEVLI